MRLFLWSTLSQWSEALSLHAKDLAKYALFKSTAANIDELNRSRRDY